MVRLMLSCLCMVIFALSLSHAQEVDIFTAVSNGNIRQVEEALKRDPSCLEKKYPGDSRSYTKGFTPLMLAIDAHGQEDMARYLVERRAKVNAASDRGETCLHIAARLNRYDKAPYLVKAGANVNAQDKYGATPLYEAANSGSRKMAEILLQAGARPDIRTTKAHTALGVARYRNYREIEQMLQRAGAKDYGEKI